MPQGEEQSRMLPVSRAFVLQLQADIHAEDEHLAGRIEHIVSGQATHFQSLADLLKFIANTLQDTDTAEPDKS